MFFFYYIFIDVYFEYFIQRKHCYLITQQKNNTADWVYYRYYVLDLFSIFDNHMRYRACLAQLSINHQQLFTTGHNCQPLALFFFHKRLRFYTLYI